MQAWNVLSDHPEAWQFLTPVKEAIAPGYHDIIKVRVTNHSGTLAAALFQGCVVF